MIKLYLKRKNLLKIAERNSDEISAFIYILISSKYLDNLILNIGDQKVMTNSKAIHKKGYLTANEQFIDILWHFINTFYNEFWYIGSNKNFIIKMLLANEDITTLLYSKKYWGDNDNINYFKYQIRKAIVNNFLIILRKIDESSLVEEFLKSKSINLDKISLNKPKDTDKLFIALKELCCGSPSEYVTLYLFDNRIDSKVKDQYLIQIERLIENYYKRKKVVNILLKMY